MKKFIPTIFIVFFLFGEMTLFADPGTDYGSWSTAPGWPGLNYRVKRNSSSPGDQTFTWWVQFDNTYNQKITFSYNLTPPNSPPPTLTDGMTLGAGRENEDWFNVGAHDSVQVWVGQVTLGDGTTANMGNSQSSTSSSQQNSIQQEQAQLQQQQQQAVQQSLQQQQAALQQQIADKRAALQEQKQELETKRQQIINDYEAKAQTYQALGNAVQNAANQIADYLQQQEQQKEAREAQEQEQQQEQDIQNQERQLQDQLGQLQQQAADNQNNNQNAQNNYAPAPVMAPAAPPPPEPAHVRRFLGTWTPVEVIINANDKSNKTKALALTGSFVFSTNGLSQLTCAGEFRYEMKNKWQENVYSDQVNSVIAGANRIDYISLQVDNIEQLKTWASVHNVAKEIPTVSISDASCHVDYGGSDSDDNPYCKFYLSDDDSLLFEGNQGQICLVLRRTTP